MIEKTSESTAKQNIKTHAANHPEGENNLLNQSKGEEYLHGLIEKLDKLPKV